MPALAELEAAWIEARDDAGFQRRARRGCCATTSAARRRCTAARRLSRARRPPDLPQARGPQPHRRAQDQQRARPGAAGQADGQDADHRRDRRRPARRRHRDRVRAARPRVHRLHGHRGHAPPEAQRRSGWSCWARRVEPVEAGARTLKEAVSAAIRDWVTNVGDTHYIIGSCVGPAPYPGARARPPARDRRRGARAGARSATGRLPERVIACVGGGSNAIGIFAAVRRRRRRRADRRRGRRRGDRDRPPRRAADRRRAAPASCTARYSAIMQDEDGQILEAHSISAGLDYPGTGPEHAWLRDTGRATLRRDHRRAGARRVRSGRAARGDHPGARDRSTRSPGRSPTGASRARPRLPVRPRRQGPRRGARARRWTSDDA